MSGIYIPGMGMPKNGHITITISDNGDVVCNSEVIDGKYQYRSYGRIGKAIPVPDHGRLIDTDAVSLEGGPYEYDEWCKWALEQYQDAPTIIPADKEVDNGN